MGRLFHEGERYHYNTYRGGKDYNGLGREEEIVKQRIALTAFSIIAPAAFLLTGCAHSRGEMSSSRPRVLIGTELGDILVELYPDRAPITTANFMRYVDEKRFAGASFYRTVTLENQVDSGVKIEVIQGGLGWKESEARLDPIPHETTAETGVRHTDGTISMARNEPGSADSEFFICVGDQPELDFGGKRNRDGQGFAAFGRVIAGLDVVKQIHSGHAEGQMLTPEVRITDVHRARRDVSRE